MIARKVDSNQKKIVQQLRKIGVSVYVTSMVGKGFPDLVCGFRGKNYLLELKDGAKSKSRKRLTPDERKFFQIWNGEVFKVENFDEILEIIT